MLQVCRTDRLCGKDLDGGGSGVPACPQLGWSEAAGKDRDLAFHSEPDHRHVHGGSHQIVCAAIDRLSCIVHGEDGAHADIGCVGISADEVRQGSQ